MSTQDQSNFYISLWNGIYHSKVLLQVKGENLKKIKVGLTFVDGMGSGYSATWIRTIKDYYTQGHLNVCVIKVSNSLWHQSVKIKKLDHLSTQM